MNNEKDVLRLGKKLNEMMARKEFTQALDILNVLKDTPITYETLQKTPIGSIVVAVRYNCPNEEVKTQAKLLSRSWKKLIGPRDGQSDTVPSDNGKSTSQPKKATSNCDEVIDLTCDGTIKNNAPSRNPSQPSEHAKVANQPKKATTGNDKATIDAKVTGQPKKANLVNDKATIDAKANNQPKKATSGSDKTVADTTKNTGPTTNDGSNNKVAQVKNQSQSSENAKVTNQLKKQATPGNDKATIDATKNNVISNGNSNNTPQNKNQSSVVKNNGRSIRSCRVKSDPLRFVQPVKILTPVPIRLGLSRNKVPRRSLHQLPSNASA